MGGGGHNVLWGGGGAQTEKILVNFQSAVP